jgi:hypothetical protein
VITNVIDYEGHDGHPDSCGRLAALESRLGQAFTEAILLTCNAGIRVLEFRQLLTVVHSVIRRAANVVTMRYGDHERARADLAAAAGNNQLSISS